MAISSMKDEEYYKAQMGPGLIYDPYAPTDQIQVVPRHPDPRLPKPPMECIPWGSLKYTHTHESAVSARDGLVHWWCSTESKSTELLPRIPTNMLEGVAHVLGAGTEKIGAAGRDIFATPWSVKFAAAMRHAARVDAGDLIDPHSGFPHEWHFWGNVAVLWRFVSEEMGTDDRGKP